VEEMKRLDRNISETAGINIALPIKAYVEIIAKLGIV